MGSITTQESATPLINYLNVAPGAFKAMVGLESYLRGCGLGPSLIEMVKLRVSQINRYAYCIDIHTKKLLAEGSRTNAFTGSRRGAKGTTTAHANKLPSLGQKL